MNLSQKDMTPKPLSLKQRTSSVDANRDATVNTWLSAIGLLKLREFLITVDHFSIWKRHLAWAIADGKELRDYMTQRYSSSMVFMSLLLSTELSVLFNSAVVTTDVRRALEEERYETVAFWVGIFIIVSAILSLLGLVATFTAWGMVSAVNEVNAHCVFRSSIGQYVAELPGNFIVGSIYTFSIWMILFFFLLLPVGFSSFLLLGITLGLFLHIITAFSAFGRIIMHSGAMGSNRIFDPVFESTLSPCSLHANLLSKARETLSNEFSIRRQYAGSDPINHDLTILDQLKNRICPPKDDQPEFACNDPDDGIGHIRNLYRTGSSVQFSDGFDTNGLVSDVFHDTAPFFAASNKESEHDWMVHQPHRDRDEDLGNERDLLGVHQTSGLVATWRKTKPISIPRNIQNLVKNDDDDVQRLETAYIDNTTQLKPLIQSSDKMSPSSATSHHRSARQSTSHWEGNLKLSKTEIGDYHGIIGKGEEAGQIPKGPWRTNERSRLLAFSNESDNDSTPL